MDKSRRGAIVFTQTTKDPHGTAQVPGDPVDTQIIHNLHGLSASFDEMSKNGKSNVFLVFVMLAEEPRASPRVSRLLKRG
jgi:hypothetical protein